MVYFNKIETDQQGQRVAESSRKLSKGWGVAQVLAEQMLDNAMLRDVNLLTARPDAKRKSATHLVESHQVNQHWASSALNLDRSTLRYQSRRKEHAHLRNAKRRLQRNVAGSAIGRCP